MLGARPEGLDALLSEWGIDPADLPLSVVLRAREVAGIVPAGTELVPIVERYARNPSLSSTGPMEEVAVIPMPLREKPFPGARDLSTERKPLAWTSGHSPHR